MRIFLTFVIILSCAANIAHADVMATNGAVVITNNRYLNGDNTSRAFYRYNGYNRDTVIIPSSNNNSNNALIIKDGKAVIPRAGNYDLGNGSNITVDQQGRANGRVGNVNIRN